MPSEMIKKSPLKAKPNLATIPTQSSGTASENCSTPIATTTTHKARFTSEEKKILYSLFNQYEYVIDIKNRKKQKEKHSIRDAWQSIVDGFNGHPNVAVHRNLMQIQKFWLNARLRKQYPLNVTKDTKPKATISTTAEIVARTVPLPIKCETEYSLLNEDTSGTTENIDEYQEIEQQGILVSDPLAIEIERLDESTETVQNQQENQDRIQQNKIQQQKHKTTINQTQQQINVDHISADKLTLNDLLQFKNVRPKEDIIFEIKQPDGRTTTLPSPNRITIIPRQESTYNQTIGEIKGQPHLQVQHYQAPLQITQQQIEQQYNAVNSTYYTYATKSQPHASTLLNASDIEIGNSKALVGSDSFEDKFNYFKLKEIELRHKEVQLLSEQKRIELSKMQEELRHKQEMHRLQVEEMQIKLRILCEEEKQLIIKAS